MNSKKITLFSIGFITRSLIGIIVYGGIDVRSYLDLARATLHFSLPTLDTFFNYFPLGAFYWWFCGFLHAKTALPLPFCVKCVPIFFDALLGVLIYEFLLRRKKTYAFHVGLLYALNPVTIVVDCIHGQWESVFLFFLFLSFYIRDFYENSIKKYLVVGFLFTISFLLKPVSLVFIPLIFERIPDFFTNFGRLKRLMTLLIASFSLYLFAGLAVSFFMIKKYKMTLPLIFSQTVFWLFLGGVCIFGVGILVIFFKKIWPQFSLKMRQLFGYQSVMALCGLTTTVVALSIFTFWLGFDLKQVFDTMLRFFNQGTQIIGLPMGRFFTTFPVLGVILKNRLWTLAFFGVAVFCYYKGIIRPFTAMLFLYACIFGFTAVSPHYLVWIIPFALLEGFYWWTAVYSFFVFVMSVFYYAHPFSSPIGAYHNIMSFALLKPFSWLMAPDVVTKPVFLKIIHLLGNYVIPLICLVLFLYIIKLMLLHRFDSASYKQVSRMPEFYFLKNYFLVILASFTMMIIFLMAVNNSMYLYHEFQAMMPVKMQAYDVIYGGGLPPRAVYGPFHMINIISLFFLFGILWFVYACYVAYKIKKIE